MKILFILLLVALSSHAQKYKGFRNRCSFGFDENGECDDDYDNIKFEENEKVIEFSWNLFKETSTLADDIVLSPYSVQLLLSYLSTAAENPTKSQITNSVKFEDPAQLNALRKEILRRGGKREFQFANLFMYEQNMNLNSNFSKNLKKWQVQTIPLDFSNPEAAQRTFQREIRKKVKGKLNPTLGSISPSTRMILSNVIYFNADWVYEFETAVPGQFFLKDGSSVTVDYLHLDEKLRFGDTDFGKWVELPYDSAFQSVSDSMIVIAPKKDVDEFIKEFTIEQATQLFKRTRSNDYANVNLTMPKFNIESTVSLVDSLRKLGVTDLFTANAKLPYISDNESILINEVQQQSKMEIDEKGTIAAAVTSFSGIALSYTPPVKDVNMEVTKPFLVMIVDKTQKVPMFIAKVTNPTPSKS